MLTTLVVARESSAITHRALGPSRLIHMPSVAERIAALTKSPSTRGSSKKVDNTDDEKPDGEILWHGWLHRAGAGVLASTWNKRYCVVHIAASGPLLSLYDSMAMEKLKGGRLSLTSAHLSQADDKLQLSATAADGKDAGTKVHVRLKAGSTKEAVDCAGVFQCAINGQRVPTAEEKRALSTKGSLVGGVELGGEGSTKIQSPPPKASPQKSSPADEAAAAAEAEAEKLQRQKSAEAMEAAKEAERARQIEEARRLAAEEAAARKANQEAADKAMEVERQRRMSEGPESPSSKQASELQRKESQRAVDAAMEAERTRRVGEVVAEEITTSVQRRASIKQADIAMEMERREEWRSPRRPRRRRRRPWQPPHFNNNNSSSKHAGGRRRHSAAQHTSCESARFNEQTARRPREGALPVVFEPLKLRALGCRGARQAAGGAHGLCRAMRGWCLSECS